MDGLVPDTDKIPDQLGSPSFRGLFKRIMTSGRSMFLILLKIKTGSTEQLTSEVYYDLFWNAAHHHDLNNATGHKKRQPFILQQVDSFDESDPDPGEDTLLDQDNHLFNSSKPQKPTKSFIPNQLWGEIPEAAMKLIIEYNKKVKVVNTNHFFNGGNPQPKPTLGKPNQKPQQVHSHEMNDHSPVNPHPRESTQAMVHECLTDGGIDSLDINTVMSAFKTKSGNPSQDSSRKIKVP